MPRRLLADAHRSAFGRMKVVVRKPHNLPKVLVLPFRELGRHPPARSIASSRKHGRSAVDGF